MFTFRSAYTAEPRLRASFKSFLRSIHRVDLDSWDECGYWDPRYMPFSYFEGDEVVIPAGVLAPGSYRVEVAAYPVGPYEDGGRSVNVTTAVTDVTIDGIGPAFARLVGRGNSGRSSFD